MLALFGSLGFTEILMITLIALLLFGARKLPELAHSMGSSVQAFKKGMRDGVDDAQKVEEKPKADAHSNNAHH
jgi:sec-independent protein translocase protein TatA